MHYSERSDGPLKLVYTEILCQPRVDEAAHKDRGNQSATGNQSALQVTPMLLLLCVTVGFLHQHAAVSACSVGVNTGSTLFCGIHNVEHIR